MNTQATESRRPSALYATCYTLIDKLLKQNGFDLVDFTEIKDEQTRFLHSPTRKVKGRHEANISIHLPYLHQTNGIPRFSLDITKIDLGEYVWTFDVGALDDAYWVAHENLAIINSTYRGPKPVVRDLCCRNMQDRLSLEQAVELIQRCIDFYKSLPESKD